MGQLRDFLFISTMASWSPSHLQTGQTAYSMDVNHNHNSGFK